MENVAWFNYSTVWYSIVVNCNTLEITINYQPMNNLPWQPITKKGKKMTILSILILKCSTLDYLPW